MRPGWISALFVTLFHLAASHTERRSFVDHHQALTDHGNYHSSESDTIRFIRKRHLSRRSDHLSNEDHKRSAVGHLKILLPAATFEVLEDSYTDSDTGVSHVYLAQTYEGMRIANSDANVNVLRDGVIFSAGISYNITEGIYLDTSIVNSSRRLAPLSALETLKGVIKKLKLSIDIQKAFTDEVMGTGGSAAALSTIHFSSVTGVTEQPTASLVTYYHKGRLVWAWRLHIAMNGNVLQVMADAHKKGRIYSVSDHVKDIGYRVYPFGSQNYTSGNHILVQDPQKLQYSPLGWHSFGPSNSASWSHWDHLFESNSTAGNNAIAIDSRGWVEQLEDESDQAMWSRSQAKATGIGPVFDYPHDPKDPDGKNKYVDSGIVHAFYIVNCYHDLLYSLGFTPASGNFEETKLPEGGYGGDAVLIKVMWDNTTNNAFFYTPIDGSDGRYKRPVMTLMPFQIGNGIINSAFDSNIIIHEYTHGLSTRLVGGPRRSCLHSVESGALGEAWSDFFAVAIHLQPGDTRDTPQYVGTYASQNPRGLRRYPYTSDMKANPMTFSTLNNQTELNGVQISFLHHMGSLMANTLLEMTWNLIDKHGRQKDLFPVYKKGTAVPTKGVQLAMRLVVESFKLSSCEPTFLSARDTVLDADRLLTRGENQCEIWRAFAKRGMGIKASQYKNSRASVSEETNFYDRTVRWIRVESFELPKECK